MPNVIVLLMQHRNFAKFDCQNSSEIYLHASVYFFFCTAAEPGSRRQRADCHKGRRPINRSNKLVRSQMALTQLCSSSFLVRIIMLLHTQTKHNVNNMYFYCNNCPNFICGQNYYCISKANFWVSTIVVTSQLTEALPPSWQNSWSPGGQQPTEAGCCFHQETSRAIRRRGPSMSSPMTWMSIQGVWQACSPTNE